MMRDAAIVTVGSELTDGLRLDLHTRHIASNLSVRGCRVTESVSLPDDAHAIAVTLSRLIGTVDLIIVTGGLGPTHDDVTLEAASEATGLALLTDPRLERRLAGVAMRHGDAEAVERTYRMARILEGARVIDPTTGAAPGLVVTSDRTTIALLPGPPREMHPMLAALLEGLGGATVITREIGFVGLTESDVQVAVSRILNGRTDVGFTVLARTGDVRVVLRDINAGSGGFESLVREVGELFPGRCYSTKGESLAQAVLSLARTASATLSCAESCTGGMVAAALTDVPGSSSCFLGSAVTYADDAKIGLLGVVPEDLSTYGAVSERVALQMAVGAREAFGSDLAVAVTGIAGPGGGTPDKPVGSVWFAVADDRGQWAVLHHLSSSNRGTVRERATVTALDLLRQALSRM